MPTSLLVRSPPPKFPTYTNYRGFSLAPIHIVETHIRRFHAQGVSYDKMIPMLRKHYDTNAYGLGYVLSSFPPFSALVS